MVRTGVYWHHEVYDLARSAYAADLDATPAGPEYFVEWLRQAIEAHIARDPDARDALRAQLPDIATARGFNQMFPLPTELLDQVKTAIAADRRQLDRFVSRSAFIREAVVVAAEAARRRRGGTLPPPPQYLPNRRPRHFH
jgi:hypothetical protein